MPACPEKLVKYINKHFPNYTPQTAYEAGFCGMVQKSRVLGYKMHDVAPGQDHLNYLEMIDYLLNS